ncbi:MAG: HD domain-containing protein, partial [Oscillospiraceae bacterium]|nr:HD domain-containing protein [Oscillospiraceae bacterium]
MAHTSDVFDITTNNEETDAGRLLSEFHKRFGGYTAAEAAAFDAAWQFLVAKTAGRTRACGKPYYLHPMRVASLLADVGLDADSVVAGLFHDVLSLENVTKEEIRMQFGETVCKIVSDTSKITGMKINSKTIQQADNIRKMLFAMIDDVRVILVKLADRLDRMRNLKSIDEKSRRLVAAEVMDIWAPLADRLGMQSMKNELEDLSLK